MEHLRLTFEDIMQSSILYYDHEVEAACFDICDFLQIDNLPALDGRHFYELSERCFIKKPLGMEHKLQINEAIFGQDIFERFEVNKQNVLFVFEEDVMRGVVHICDFNRDVVLQAIQDDVLSFERKLRTLIMLHGFGNDAMRQFFERRLNSAGRERDVLYYEGKVKTFQGRLEEMDSLSPFQVFDLTDLMDFARCSFSDNVHVPGTYDVNGIAENAFEVLRNIRNMAMHGKNPVSKLAGTSIFSMASLRMLLDGLRVLRQEYALVINKIRNHPDFIRSVELENRSRLEIIHNHHPKALEYFLGW